MIFFPCKISLPSKILSQKKRQVAAAILLCVLSLSSSRDIFAQKKNAVFQTGERLTYKVKFGFIKLGTVVIETGALKEGNHINTRMQYWTAQVPFLDAKDVLDDVIDTSAVCLMRFEEHGYDGDKKINRSFFYDPEQRIISYSDPTVKNRIIPDVRPFSDALTLFFNLREWNGSGARYYIPLRGHAGEKLINCYFSRNEDDEKCPAFDDKQIQTYIVEGIADMGPGAPLGATGKFTAYITEDQAAIPIRIDMKIAIGSISLVLDKAERAGWQP
jgi:hypothetical protein